jgi:integrase
MHGHVRKRGKRKDGSTRWEARYPNPVLGGTAKIEKVFRTKQEAEDWLIREASAQQRGEWIDPREAERPFADVFAEWQQGWHTLSPNTKRRYEGIVNTYLLPEFGRVPVGRINHAAVQTYVDRLAATRRHKKDCPERDCECPTIAAGTVRNVYAVLRTAMAKGVRMGRVKVNPCVDVDLPQRSREQMLFLTANEVGRLAEAIDEQYRVWVYTAAYTGLRAGELAGLQRRDVDLLRGVLHVRQALKDVNGHLELGPTKTHAHRTVSLPKFLSRMLSDHLTKPGTATTPDDLVFTMKGGQPLRHGLVYSQYFRKAVVAALPASNHELRFHDLRHTCASLSIAAGAHPKLISARLGHSTITITLDRYGHLFPSVEEALAEKLDATFVAAEDEADDAAVGNVVALR